MFLRQLVNMNNIDEMIDEALDAKAKKKAVSEWYNLRPILGYFN